MFGFHFLGLRRTKIRRNLLPQNLSFFIWHMQELSERNNVFSRSSAHILSDAIFLTKPGSSDAQYYKSGTDNGISYTRYQSILRELAPPAIYLSFVLIKRFFW